MSLRFVNWASSEESTKANIEKVIAAFEAANPNITIVNEPVPFATKGQTLLTQVAAGNPPDVAQVAQADPFDLAAAGALLDLKAAGLADDDYLADSYESAILAGTVDDAFVAAPWILTTFGLWYNKELAVNTSGGQPAPETLDDLLANIQQLNNSLGDDTTPIGLDTKESSSVLLLEYYPYFFAFGARPLYGSPNFDTPEMVQALTWLQNLVTEGHTKLGLNLVDIRALAANGQVAYWVDGPFGQGILGSLNPALEGDAFHDKVGVIPFPCGPAGCGGTAANLHQLVIFKNTAHPAEAWEFVKFLVQSDTSIVDYQLPLGAIPASKGAVTGVGASALSNPVAQQWIKNILPQQQPAPYGPNFSPSVPIVVNALQRVLLNGEDPATVATETEAELQAAWR